MARTVADIQVVGRNQAEVRALVVQWMSAHGLTVKSENQVQLVAHEGSIWLTGEKIYAIWFTPQPWGVHVHTEGYLPDIVGGEFDFDPGAFFMGLPRRSGHKKLSDLWSRLRGASQATVGFPPPVYDRPPQCPTCRGPTELAVAYGRWFCRKCSKYA